MFKNHLDNQKGITLVEVLAVLLLLSIILTLSFSIFINVVEQNARSTSHVNVRQEANLVISQIRNKHYTEESEEYALCLEDVQPSQQFEFDSFSIDGTPFENCQNKNPHEDLLVSFTLLDEFDNDFTIDTTIEAKKEIIEKSKVSISLPSFQRDFYTYLKEENVFVYGAGIDIGGGNNVKSHGGEGQIVIDNSNKKDLEFTRGGQTVSVPKIYIDKTGNTIRYKGGSGMGESGITELISIKGDLEIKYGNPKIISKEIFIDGSIIFDGSAKIESQEKTYIKGNVVINNGNPTLSSKEVYIDGSVTFDGSGRINADKVYISGDVNFNKWDTYINAKEIYVEGNVYSATNNDAHKNIPHGEFISSDLPKHPKIQIPKLRGENWYSNNGYERKDTLEDNVKIFTNDFTFRKLQGEDQDYDLNNVTIVSKGDIDLSNMGGISLSGILFAPNGKVIFKGESFKGMVIAKDGFDTSRGGTDITFRNIQHYFSSSKDVPFK